MTFPQKLLNRAWLINLVLGFVVLIVLSVFGPGLMEDKSFLAKSFVRFYKLRVLVGFLWGVGCAALYAIDKVLNHTVTKKINTHLEPIPRWIQFFVLAVLGVVIARSVFQLNLNLEWDEYNIGAALYPAKFTEVANPFLSGEAFIANTNQIITNIASYLSIQAMGLSPASLRLPSIAFTLLLSLSVWFLCRRHLTAFGATLLCLHLFANFNFGWYSHSAKGYISLMAAGAAVYLWLLEMVKDDGKRFPGWVFWVAGAATALAHTMGSLYLGLIFLSLLLWACLQTKIPEGVKKATMRLLVLLPFAGAFIVYHLSRLGSGRMELFQKGIPVDFDGGALGNSLGYGITPSYLFLSLFLLLCAATVACTSKNRLRSDIKGQFLIVSTFMLLGIVYGMEPGFFRGRWLLIFLVPLLTWLGDAIAEIKWKYPRYGLMACAITMFVVMPFLQRKEATFNHERALFKYHAFLQRSREIMKDLPTNCYLTSGDGFHQSRWTRMFYFPGAGVSVPNLCGDNYLLAFHPDLVGPGPDFANAIPDGAKAELLHNDHDGRRLYRYTPN